MSRVIKAAVWRDEPHIIEPPNAKKSSDGGDALAGMDEEAYSQKLAEIAEKEQQARKILQEAKVSCDMMKQEAEEQRDRILMEAKQECEVLRSQAREEGHKEGFRAGREEGAAKIREEMQDTIKAANAQAERTLQAAKEATRDYLVQADNEVAEVVMHVVEKVLPQHFIDVPQVILPLVREALFKVQDQKEIVIHVAPACYELVLMARDEFRAMLPGGNTSLEVHSDDSLQPGDCLIETPNGSVDARLATQLELIRSAVQEVTL